MAPGKNVRIIGFEELGRFGVDEDGNLCLDGKPIEVKRMHLTRWQAILANVVAIVVIAQGIVSILQAFEMIP